MDQIYVADTNLFLECKRLEEIPWADLGLDPIVIVLTQPVISEIDKHKRLRSRTRKRALSISKRIRQMLESCVLETLVCEGAPRVTIRLATTVKPDSDFEKDLDYESNDDRLVGIVSTVAKDYHDHPVSFLTDDAVAASTALTLGIQYSLINENWKRPPEQTNEEKRIKELESELATYKAQEPCIVLKCMTQESGNMHYSQKKALPLSVVEINTLIASLQSKHPLETEFDLPKEEELKDGTRVYFEPPDLDEVAKYRSESYPNWVSECRSILENLHDKRNYTESSLGLVWRVKNEGARPAISTRITFYAKGNIRLRRDLTDSSAENGNLEVETESSRRILPSIPRPPSPPRVRRKVDRSQVKSTPSRHNLLFTPEKDFFRDPFKRNIAEVTDVSVEPILRSIPSFNVPKHDKEAFYYDEWEPNELVSRGSLTCDLYRHQDDEELFELEVVFCQDGDVQAAVICTVHAENLTSPESVTVPVSKTMEVYSLFEDAKTMIDKCGESILKGT